METVGLQRVRFARFELDLETSELWSDGRRVDLAPQPSRILAILVSRAGRLVERSELRRQIWGESWREWETGLHQAIRRIRVVLGDSARAPSFIETVPRRGYRFIGELETMPSRAPASPSSDPKPRRLDGVPSFLPFRSSRAATLSVLLLLSSLAVAPGAPSRKAREAAGAPSESAVGQVATELPERPSPEAMRLLREGRHLLASGKVTAALAKLHRAAEQDPGWAEPWSSIAEAELARPDPPDLARGGSGRVEAARRALESALVRDPEDGRSWLLLARLRLWQEWDWSGARQALHRAVRIHPDDPGVWQLVAALETVSGRTDEALEAARRAMSLDPISTALSADLGWTLYYSGRLEEALAECRRTLELEPENAIALQCAVQALLALERSADAASMIVRSTKGWVGSAPPEPSAVLAAYSEAQVAAIESRKVCGSSAASAIPKMVSGEVSGALDALVAGALEGKGWEVPFSRIDPLFAPWRSDSRFTEVERALNLPDPATISSGF